MMQTRNRATLTLCCLLLAGCHRKAAVVAPPPAPPLAMVSVPPPTHQTEALALIPLEVVPNPDLLLPRKLTRRFRPLAATKSQLAALTPPPAPVALGRLTTGGEAGNGTLRQQTEDLLRGQMRRVAGLSTDTIAGYGEQVQQAKLFLRQAEEAWRNSDVEGARTLATKAKLLLDELPA